MFDEALDMGIGKGDTDNIKKQVFYIKNNLNCKVLEIKFLNIEEYRVMFDSEIDNLVICEINDHVDSIIKDNITVTIFDYVFNYIEVPLDRTDTLDLVNKVLEMSTSYVDSFIGSIISDTIDNVIYDDEDEEDRDSYAVYTDGVYDADATFDKLYNSIDENNLHTLAVLSIKVILEGIVNNRFIEDVDYIIGRETIYDYDSKTIKDVGTMFIVPLYVLNNRLVFIKVKV